MCVGGVPYKKKEHVQANLSRPRLFVAFVSAENDAKERNVTSGGPATHVQRVIRRQSSFVVRKGRSTGDPTLPASNGRMQRSIGVAQHRFL